ncbi:hypothetical protein JR338_06655 [Chloroflexota bacterium]|nr:hypothetical protein JR338_06655 [Chloroflexota bacterium]
MTPIDATPIFDVNQSLWTENHQAAGCLQCGRVYIVQSDQLGQLCPLCRKGTLEPQPVRMRAAEPEQILPFRINQANLSSIYANAVSRVWIKPEDLTAESLLRNTRPVFWPLWLVDSDVQGHWQMEAGFDYQVESAKEYYNGGRWQSSKQIEGRVRWEPRLGRINTHVDNIAAQALEEYQNRLQMTGKYPLEQSRPYSPGMESQALLEVPDFPPEDAWPLARPAVEKAAGDVCLKAAGAQHFRNFSIKAEYTNLNWTQFLLPLFATHYTDDEGEKQILIVNGVTGAIQGPLLASPKRGGKIAGIIAAVAGGLILLALLGFLLTLVLPAASIIAGILGVLGVLTGIGAIFPLVQPRQWNANQTGPRIAKGPRF